MKAGQLFEELFELAKQLGFSIRKDSGNFRSNNCILKSEKIILLNKFSPIAAQNRTLSAAINDCDTNAIFIKPAVREFLTLEAEKPLDDALKDFSIET